MNNRTKFSIKERFMFIKQKNLDTIEYPPIPIEEQEKLDLQKIVNDA